VIVSNYSFEFCFSVLGSSLLSFNKFVRSVKCLQVLISFKISELSVTLLHVR
jgi:hypothetical protein